MLNFFFVTVILGPYSVYFKNKYKIIIIISEFVKLLPLAKCLHYFVNTYF